jgi:aminomethyltransferase
METPFHARIEAFSSRQEWYVWNGYRTALVVTDSELEYFAIRSTAALFDISPMVKYAIIGPDAESCLDRLTLRDVTRHAPMRVQYTAWCDDEGQVLDDGTLFRFGRDSFRLYCQERHLPWLLDSAIGYDVSITEVTEDIAGLALQGPTSCAILKNLGFQGIENLKPFVIAQFKLGNSDVTVSRTGFTGDLGYELFVDAGFALSLWDALMEAGALHGIAPIGYAALDHARLEAGFIVANHDFVTADSALRQDRTRFPAEIGLEWLIDPKKGHFNGRRAILEAQENGRLRHVLVGIEIEGNIPADNALVYHRKTREVGLVMSACWSPTGKRNIALASLQRPYGTQVLDDLWVEIYAMRELQYQRMMKPVRIVERPFIKLPRRTVTPAADK